MPEEKHRLTDPPIQILMTDKSKNSPIFQVLFFLNRGDSDNFKQVSKSFYEIQKIYHRRKLKKFLYSAVDNQLREDRVRPVELSESDQKFLRDGLHTIMCSESLDGRLKRKHPGVLILPRGSLLNSLCAIEFERVTTLVGVMSKKGVSQIRDRFFPKEGRRAHLSASEILHHLPFYIYKKKGQRVKKALLERIGHILPDVMKGRNPLIRFYPNCLGKGYLDGTPWEIIVEDSDLKDSLDELSKIIKANQDIILTVNLKDQFVGKYGELSGLNLPFTRHLRLIDENNNITSFDRDFAFGVEGILTLDVSGMTNVRRIGSNFFINCTNLRRFDGSGFTQLHSIEDRFLANCRNLVSFNGSNMVRLERIRNSFLEGATSLNTFDCFGMSRLRSIGNSFMKGTSLTHFDGHGFISLNSIGNEFLQSCRELKTFSGNLFQLKVVGNNFLSECSNLERFDPLIPNLKTIGDDFLRNCRSLTHFDSSRIKGVQKIGNWFLFSCEALYSFDSCGLKNLKNVGDQFLYDCPNLQRFVNSESSRGLFRFLDPLYYLTEFLGVPVIDTSALEKVKDAIPTFFIGNPYLYYANWEKRR